MESRAGRIHCDEHDGGGSLVGTQENHQHVDEKAVVVRPAADQVPHQGENECAAIRRGGSGGFVARMYIERCSSEGWASPLMQSLQEKCRFLAAILLQFPWFRRLLVTVALLGNRLEQG